MSSLTITPYKRKWDGSECKNDFKHRLKKELEAFCKQPSKDNCEVSISDEVLDDFINQCVVIDGIERNPTNTDTLDAYTVSMNSDAIISVTLTTVLKHKPTNENTIIGAIMGGGIGAMAGGFVGILGGPLGIVVMAGIGGAAGSITGGAAALSRTTSSEEKPIPLKDVLQRRRLGAVSEPNNTTIKCTIQLVS